MAVSNDYLHYVLEQLAGIGPVSSRRMFGGIGLYLDGFFFGLISSDMLYLKVNDSNRPDFETRGMGAFRPFPDRPVFSMTYYEVPADILEDSEQLAAWAHKSVAVAVSAANAASAAKRKRKKPAGKQARRVRQM